MTVAIILAYLASVLFVGLLSNRLFRGTGEDYFLATRSIGPFVLLMSLFGTHMTAFSLLGASGEAYRTGIGVYGLMASSSAIVVPAVFWFVGRRLWLLGKDHGYLTQVQFFRDRWRSDGLGLLLFVVLVLLLVPYLMIGVMGGGITLNQISDGQIPRWLGSLAVCGVVTAYVTSGGLRGTAWANTFQTLVFMVLGAVTFLFVVQKVGGLGVALDAVRAEAPELLIRGDRIPPLKLLTYTAIPLSVGMFPHIFMHWLTARGASSFRLPVVAYPLCVTVVWVPSVLLGMIGRAEIPGLEGPAASSVLVRLIDLHAPEVLAGLLAAGVFAAIMSSLDSQVLSLGTMFTQDVVRHYGLLGRLEGRREVWVGRFFVVGLLSITFALSFVTPPSIFRLGIWSFTGFASLFPLVVAAVYWKRSTRAGAWAAVLTAIGLWLYFFSVSGHVPDYSVGGTGTMPVAVILVATSAVLVVVSLLTRPPEPAVLERFFPEVLIMNIAYITAGAGGMICGSCLHDNTLAGALTRLGHDVTLVPIYTPIRTDEADNSSGRVFYGAINVYLEQHSALFRHTPWLVDRLFSGKKLLDWAVKRGASNTDARELGAITLSVLRGEDGKQRKELERLVEWLRDEVRPEVVLLTNSMLIGMARRIKEELGVPVLCSIQGEDIFFDDLPQDWLDRVLATLRERARDIDGFVSNSRYYAEHMAPMLGVSPESIHVIELGLKVDDMTSEPPVLDDRPFTVGYLARVCPEKGLHLLVEAFRRIAEEAGRDQVRLRIAGYQGARDQEYYDGIRHQIRDWGLDPHVDLVGEVDRQGKVDFLRSLHVLSVPTTYREPKGLFALEAMANSVPVVQPDHGAFPEMIGALGGGVLCEPHSVDSLVEHLGALMRDPERRRELGRTGRGKVLTTRNDEVMARRTIEFLEGHVGAVRRPAVGE